MERHVEPRGGVGRYAVHVSGGGPDEVDGRRIGHRLPRTVDVEGEGDTVVAEVAELEHRRQDGDTGLIHHQDLVRIVLPLTLAAVRQLLLVQVQHPHDNIWIRGRERD